MDDKKDNIKDAMERDLEQTKSDVPGLEGQDLNQDVDDTIRQAAGKDDVEGNEKA